MSSATTIPAPVAHVAFQLGSTRIDVHYEAPRPEDVPPGQNVRWKARFSGLPQSKNLLLNDEALTRLYTAYQDNWYTAWPVSFSRKNLGLVESLEPTMILPAPVLQLDALADPVPPVQDTLPVPPAIVPTSEAASTTPVAPPTTTATLVTDAPPLETPAPVAAAEPAAAEETTAPEAITPQAAAVTAQTEPVVSPPVDAAATEEATAKPVREKAEKPRTDKLPTNAKEARMQLASCMQEFHRQLQQWGAPNRPTITADDIWTLTRLRFHLRTAIAYIHRFSNEEEVKLPEMLFQEKSTEAAIEMLSTLLTWNQLTAAE